MKKTSCLSEEGIKLIIDSYKAQFTRKNYTNLDESKKESLEETRPDLSHEVRPYRKSFD